MWNHKLSLSLFHRSSCVGFAPTEPIAISYVMKELQYFISGKILCFSPKRDKAPWHVLNQEDTIRNKGGPGSEILPASSSRAPWIFWIAI